MKKIIGLLLIAGFFYTDVKSQLTGGSSIGVRLSSFNAFMQNNEVWLNWKVSCRISFAKFEVQRSADGINFITINSFKADYLRCQQPFDYRDPSSIGLVFYRLKVGNIDGEFSTEKVVKVPGKEISSTEIKVVSPVTNDLLLLTVGTGNNEKIMLQILNMAGNIIQKTVIAPGAGISQIEVPILNLPPGYYILSYQSGIKTKSLKFFKIS